MVKAREHELVHFIVIGAMKSLTTSVLATLGEHPDVAVSAVKETEYFVAETGWNRGKDWYAAQFGHARPGQLRGEASPQYTFFPVYAGVPERIARCVPDVRLVYLVRDPVDRAVSQWRHARARGVEVRPLERALLEDARYQLPSRYWLQLQQYLACFDPSQIQVVDTARLLTDPASCLRDICRHIGADPDRAPTALARLNAGDDHTRPSELGQRLHRWRAVRQVERHLPARAAGAWSRVMTTADPPAEPDPALVARLWPVFEQDGAGLAGHLGDGAPRWSQRSVVSASRGS